MTVDPATSPQLACIVLSFGDEPGLVDAVRSLRSQAGDEIELVVVSSGGGDPRRALVAAGLDVPLIEQHQRLFPGAVRNLGIAATRAPWVAFLAADCLAAPGWVAARLRRHSEGAAAVASALTHAAPRNPVSWASHVALFARRLPGVPETGALRYGVSYSRQLFERFGLFPEDLRSGEDTAFNRRLDGSVTIDWAPEVRTVHRNPRWLADLLADQYRRGGRSAAAWAASPGGPSRRYVAANALERLPSSLRIAWQASQRSEKPWLAAALPLLPLAGLAYAAGALWGVADSPQPPTLSRGEAR